MNDDETRRLARAMMGDAAAKEEIFAQGRASLIEGLIEPARAYRRRTGATKDYDFGPDALMILFQASAMPPTAAGMGFELMQQLINALDKLDVLATTVMKLDVELIETSGRLADAEQRATVLADELRKPEA